MEVNGNFERQIIKLSELEMNKKWQKYMNKYFIITLKGQELIQFQLDLKKEVRDFDLYRNKI